MKLLVGLGNPGSAYAKTRHNIGFLAAEQFAKNHEGIFKEKRTFSANVAECRIQEEKIIVLLPTTFMNGSGEAVTATSGFWHIDPKDILVVYDDADLPFGLLRFRSSGSSGGHNGMKSIIEQLKTNEIKRLRIGIGRPERSAIPLDAWVLGTWNTEEQNQLPDILKQTCLRLEELLIS